VSPAAPLHDQGKGQGVAMTSLLAHAQRLIDAGQKAPPGPWSHDNHIIWSEAGLPGGCRMEPGSYRVADIRGHGHLQYRPEGEKEMMATGDFIAIARTSPDVARALLRAVELLRDCDRTSTHGQLEADVRAFLARVGAM
jgi:hypothetical protein